MKYNEILDRIENLDKSKIIITDFSSDGFSQIALKYNGVRILDLRRPQMKKLKELGYKIETVVI